MIIEKRSKKRAYNLKTDDGFLVGAIDYQNGLWRANFEATICFTAESLRQIADFIDSKKGEEGDEATF